MSLPLVVSGGRPEPSHVLREGLDPTSSLPPDWGGSAGTRSRIRGVTQVLPSLVRVDELESENLQTTIIGEKFVSCTVLWISLC